MCSVKRLEVLLYFQNFFKDINLRNLSTRQIITPNNRDLLRKRLQVAISYLKYLLCRDYLFPVYKIAANTFQF